MYFDIILVTILLALIVFRFFYNTILLSNVLPLIVFIMISLIMFNKNVDSSTAICALGILFTGIYRMRFHWENALLADDDIWNQPLLIFFTCLVAGALLLIVNDNYEQLLHIQITEVNELPLISVFLMTFLYLASHRGES